MTKAMTHTVKCHDEAGCGGEDTDCIDEGAEQWHNTLSLLQALSMFPENARHCMIIKSLVRWLIAPFVGATFTPGARLADVGLERPLAIWEVRCAGQLLN